ncbi:FecCD family ABC transporter permease [Bacillus marinisedimentorum]|uniref:FecCD family ABC transporter permease n=1 Tax=Bacillus marinisedimentorum TaxID=1821260 RepID=UPI0007E0E66D|nr:iron ABC transporter permease [Bacillus marinisedimentorum]
MILKSNLSKLFGLTAGIILLFISILISILFGYTKTNWTALIDAYTAFDGSNEQLIIKNARVPRALIAAAVGASLGVAGTLMQALTRNPLASPGILGVNAGASFFIVVAVSFFSISSLTSFTWIAFSGAAVAALTVYFIGSAGRGGMTPVKLTLAGAAMAALFASLTQGLLVLNEKALEEVLFWLAGSVQGRKLSILTAVLPYLLVGWISSILLSKQINILLMGEDVAKGLGQRTGLVKAGGGLIVILLAGGSVAIAGPIGFVGIVVPHLARALTGTDHRWVIPYSGLIGGILLLLADVGARYIIMPQEVPVGVMTAIIGTPFFVYIARKGLTGR